MELSEKVLGTYVVGKLKEQIHRPVLQIGKDSFTKGDLSKEGCYSFKAASNLSYVVNKQLKVKDTRDLFERITPQELALPRLGVISFATLGAAFEHQIGRTLGDYMTRHQHNGNKNVSFPSLKHRDAVEVQQENKRRKDRKRTRRNLAHVTRIGRMIAKEAVMSAGSS
jgi:lipopolysaccharide/colanic/teichoic acid biosynthesis glycosyltransferase